MARIRLWSNQSSILRYLFSVIKFFDFCASSQVSFSLCQRFENGQYDVFRSTIA